MMERTTAIVTGANRGIGLFTALALAERGMEVVLVGRDPARIEAARRFVAERAERAQKGESGSLFTALADFSSLEEVRRLADALLRAHPRISLLVNNAGIMSRRFRRSAEGYELTFAVNHLAPFLLTNLLLDRLKASAPARILTVASEAHRGARLDLSLIDAPKPFAILKAYGRSKLCNILFTRELSLRLAGTGVVAAALHPGVVATGIADQGGLVGLGWRLAKPFMLSPEKGAETSVFLATTPDPAPFAGAYVVGRAAVEPDPAARDQGLARRLWEESARLTGLSGPLRSRQG